MVKRQPDTKRDETQPGRARLELEFDRPALLGPLFGQFDQNLITLENRLGVYIAARGNKVATFAVPTIKGEIRRYFRDRTWGLRVPRRVQELSLKSARL